MEKITFDLPFANETHWKDFKFLQEKSEIPERFIFAFLDYFKKDTKSQKEHFEFIKKFTSKKYEIEPNVLLFGDKGMGKTHFLTTLLNELMLLGNDCLFFDSLSLFLKIKASYNDGTYDKLIKKLTSCQYLALDDMGVNVFSEDEKKNLFVVLNARYNKFLPTFISTNNQNLEFLPSTIQDRILENCEIIHFQGESIRGKYKPIILDDEKIQEYFIQKDIEKFEEYEKNKKKRTDEECLEEVLELQKKGHNNAMVQLAIKMIRENISLKNVINFEENEGE